MFVYGVLPELQTHCSSTTGFAFLSTRTTQLHCPLRHYYHYSLRRRFQTPNVTRLMRVSFPKERGYHRKGINNEEVIRGKKCKEIDPARCRDMRRSRSA